MPPQTAKEEKLPFDIKTILVAFILRWKMIVSIIFCFLVIGIICGKILGKKVYESETILQYKPNVKLRGDPGEGTALLTYLNTVKTPQNVANLKDLLHLDCSIMELGACCDVKIQKNTMLMSISAIWNNPEEAASIAATLRDVFIENQRQSRQIEAGKLLKDYETRTADVEGQLKVADTALQAFTTKNQVVDLDKEAQWYLEQLVSLENLYEQAQIEKQTVELQTQNLKSIMDNLKKKVAEESQNSNKMENLGDLNIKVQRLRDAINEDKTYRAGVSDLNERTQEYDMAVKLFEKKLISKADLEKAKNLYEKQKALASDTEQIKQWKAEIERLNVQVLPNKGENAPSAPLLRDLMLKSFNLDLEKVAASDKVLHLEAARDKVKKKLDLIPKLQREYASLSREVEAKITEKKRLEEELGQVMIAYQSTTSDFKIIADAQVSNKASKSNGKIIALAITVIGTFFTLAVFLLIEILNPTIRSPSEFIAKLPLKLLLTLSFHSDPREVLPAENDSVFVEEFRKITHSIRLMKPERGVKILLVSALDGEGKTSCAINLATCFGRTDERVLLIDGMIRDIKTENDIASLAEFEGKEPMGLGEYLSFKAVEWSEAIWTTKFPGVSCMPRVGTAVIPELLGSNRMKELFSQLSKTFSVVLIDPPAVLSFVDAEIISKNCDCAIFVMKAGKTTLKQANKAIEAIQKTGIPIIGAILNQVSPVFERRKHSRSGI
ncbi:MAG: hypothetical protein HQM08_10735 [Candidatus Riflebacteria bacterium]|nr:hypothetical protein [Candidatus Riflebacteria bacterium]